MEQNEIKNFNVRVRALINSEKQRERFYSWIKKFNVLVPTDTFLATLMIKNWIKEDELYNNTK